MEATNAQVIKYDVTDAILTGIKEKFGELPDPTTKEGYTFVSDGLKDVKGYLAGTEKLRVAQNADALAWQRAVNAKAKSIKSALEPIRDRLAAAKKVKDDADERPNRNHRIRSHRRH